MPNLKRVNELPPKTDSKDHPTLRKIEMETNVVPPYLIMLFSEEMVLCTGCIVMPDLVISTASCLDVQVNRNDEKFLAVKITSSFTEYLKERLKKPFEESVNMTNVEERRSLEYYLHPQYLARVQDIDLVLIKLNHPFDIKENELPKMSYGKTKELRNCTTLYFALNSTKDETKLTLKTRENFMVSLWHFLAVPSMYCFDLGQTKSTTHLCPGVSGSPLIRFNELWGIASFSFPICDCNEIYFYCFIDFFAAQKWLKTYIKVKQ
ncbi:hypothetical protein Phum_PHUM427060 [Pediculus humanus corporis]|uniref:Peptidase S1 domain-containing protein n=1 Tax=Pediculus humanus subsp. corporis TaxID=121224 RepID=E0VT55_PEDHC|nr:uncharacterized protein Phum_PHUM427060 [Pediculus humanus corporis]EEB16561.1 hypothetical protein Phum_PHUM427060 [Pediculus humanus corporis]